MIRRASSIDVKGILALEEECFSEPFTKEFLTQELTTNPLAYYFVAIKEEKIVGYLGMWLLDQSQVMNFCVTTQERRSGVGARLLEAAIQVCEKEGSSSLVLEVRESNQKAISLYQKFYFEVIFIRKKYYSNGENALVMERRMSHVNLSSRE